MFTKDDILNKIIDLSAMEDYLDLDNETIENYATQISQRVQTNDTAFFGLQFSDIVARHSIEDKEIVRAITTAINTAKNAAGGMTQLEFINIKNDWFIQLFRNVADDPKSLYNALINIDERYHEENLDGLLQTGLFNTIYTNVKIREALNESLQARMIIEDDCDEKFFADVKEKFPKLFLYWISLLFVDNPNYLTEVLMKKIIEKLNVRNQDISYFYDIFEDSDREIEDDIDELTKEEVDMIL